MKKTILLWISLAVLIISVVFVLQLRKVHKNPAEPNDLLTVVIYPPAGSTRYLYTVSPDGILSSATGERTSKKQEVRTIKDINDPIFYEGVHLSGKELQKLVELVNQAAESYDSCKREVVKDSYQITLYYQGEEYHSYYRVPGPEFHDFWALGDALIELSPMPIEFEGFA